MTAVSRTPKQGLKWLSGSVQSSLASRSACSVGPCGLLSQSLTKGPSSHDWSSLLGAGRAGNGGGIRLGGRCI